MTKESQRIAIAVACGTHRVELHAQDPKQLGLGGTGTLITDFAGRRKFISDCEAPRSEWQHVQFAPLGDYLNDLNAMAEALKFALHNLMDAEQVKEFGKAVENAHPNEDLWCPETSGPDRYGFAVILIETPASVLAEQLLRTLGLWVEGGTHEPSR